MTIDWEKIRGDLTERVMYMCLRNMNVVENVFRGTTLDKTHSVRLNGSALLYIKEAEGTLELNPNYPDLSECHKKSVDYLMNRLKEIGYKVESPA